MAEEGPPLTGRPLLASRRSAGSGIARVLGAALVLAPLLAGCARPDDPGGSGEPADRSYPGHATGAPDRRATDRPAEKRLALQVEGMAEEMRVVLYRTPPGFPIPFSTYVPEDMIAEPAPSGEADGVRFVANYSGHRNENAAVRLMVAAGEDASEEDVVVLLRELARGLGTGLVEEPEPRFGWSVREFRNVAPSSRHAAAEGVMAVGRRDGRVYGLAVHHPAEYGDGFGPRAGVILDEWRWGDTAEPLRR